MKVLTKKEKEEYGKFIKLLEEKKVSIAGLLELNDNKVEELLKLTPIRVLEARLVHDMKNHLSVMTLTTEFLKERFANMDEESSNHFKMLETSIEGLISNQ